MKKIIFALLLIATQAQGAFYQSVFDLKRGGVPNQAHQVGSFNGISVYGGGRFMWVRASSASVTEVLGYIVKSAQTTSGYWVREDGITPENLGADHSGRTLALDGITQAVADSYWATQLAELGVTVNVNIDTWDWLGLQMSMYVMHKQQGGKVEGHNLRKPYLIAGSKGIKLPYLKGSVAGEGNNLHLYVIDNIYIETTGNLTDWVFRDSLFSHEINENFMTNRIFIYRDIAIYNSGTAGGGGIMINASYDNRIDNCVIKACDTAFSMRHALKTLVTNCDARQNKKVGFFVGCGKAGGATGQEQSNTTVLINCRVLISGTANEKGYVFEGVSGCRINSCIIEGAGTATTIGVSLENNNFGSMHVKEFAIYNLHCEITTNARCALYLKTQGLPIIEFDGCYSQYAYAQGLVESDAIGETYVKLRNISYNGGLFKLADRSGGQTWWNISNVTPTTGTTWDNAACWNTVAPYAKPVFAQKIDINGNAQYWYENRLTNSSYRAWEIKLGNQN